MVILVILILVIYMTFLYRLQIIEGLSAPSRLPGETFWTGTVVFSSVIKSVTT